MLKTRSRLTRSWPSFKEALHRQNGCRGSLICLKVAVRRPHRSRIIEVLIATTSTCQMPYGIMVPGGVLLRTSSCLRHSLSHWQSAKAPRSFPTTQSRNSSQHVPSRWSNNKQQPATMLSPDTKAAESASITNGNGHHSIKDDTEANHPPPTPPPTLPAPSAESSEMDEDSPIRFWIRILYLSFYASQGCLTPFLPVYYRSLGHAGSVIGLLGSIRPMFSFVVSPVWGLLADRYLNKYITLYLTFIVSVVGQLLVPLREDAQYMLIVVFVQALFSAPVKALIDSLVLDQLRDKSTYGKMRLWGQIGFALGTSGMGFILSSTSAENSKSDASFWAWLAPSPEALARLPLFLQGIWTGVNAFSQNISGYKLIFLAHALLSIPTWICLRVFHHIDKQKKLRADAAAGVNKVIGGAATETRIIDGVKLILSNSDAMIFFFLFYCVGLSSGVSETFAYVRLHEVGGTGKHIGICRLIGMAAGVPMFYMTGYLTNRFGTHQILMVSVLAYGARFFIYATAQTPWQIMPAEMIRGANFAAFWSTATIYANHISPPGLHATMVRVSMIWKRV